MYEHFHPPKTGNQNPKKSKKILSILSTSSILLQVFPHLHHPEAAGVFFAAAAVVEEAEEGGAAGGFEGALGADDVDLFVAHQFGAATVAWVGQVGGVEGQGEVGIGAFQ